jgi:hypothetical protein
VPRLQCRRVPPVIAARARQRQVALNRERLAPVLAAVVALIMSVLDLICRLIISKRCSIDVRICCRGCRRFFSFILLIISVVISLLLVDSERVIIVYIRHFNLVFKYLTIKNLKDVLESKLAAFFRKRPTQNESCNSEKPNYYNTYMLYYCGPTSPLTDSLAFVDGSELSLDEIISLWKQIHCPDSASKSTSVPGQCNQPQTSSDEETVVSELPKVVVNEKKTLVIIIKPTILLVV